jgi:hypothetical protein
MLDPVETYDHTNLTVKIHYDEFAANPHSEFACRGVITVPRA